MAKKNKRSSDLVGLEPGAVIRLRTKGGKKVWWTIEKALMPYNFKQLDEFSQNCLTKGKTATKIAQEAMAAIESENEGTTNTGSK